MNMIGQEEIEHAINIVGVRTVLEMIASVCAKKAMEHKNSVLADYRGSERWMKMFTRVEQFAEHINDA